MVAMTTNDAIRVEKGDSSQSHSADEELHNTNVEKTQQTEYVFVTGVTLILILTPVTLVYFLIMLDASIIATAIPEITTDFKSLLDVGWYGGAYQLASSAFQPLSGKIYTHFSTKWCFLIFFFIFEVGSAICGAAQSSVMFIIGRAIAGLGSSGLFNGAFTIVAAILPKHKQPIVMGINVALGQLGIALGPLIGGAFTEYATWRWCFYINLPIGALVALSLLPVRIPETTTKLPVRQVMGTAVHSLDLVGFALVSPAAIMFFLALQWGGTRYSWGGSMVIGLFVGAGAIFVLFLLWEYRKGDDAMVPFSMLRLRIIWSASVTLFFIVGAMFCSGYYLPIWFQSVQDDTPLMSGVHILPIILGQVLFSMISGVSVQAFGYYLPWIIGGTILTTIGYGLLSLLHPSTSAQKWIGYQVLLGIGQGASGTMAYIAVQNKVPATDIPIAMGIVIFCQNLGGAIFLVAAQTIFSNSLLKTLHQYAPSVNAQFVIDEGARSIRQIVSADQLPGVIEAYSKSLDRVMYLGVGTGIAAFAFCWGLGWEKVDLKK